MGQALYRKYRSKSLAEIVGQEHISRALERSIKQQRVSHAYLFTGPRGVGKTSVARILAHQVNDLPYSDESTHLDIIEIDAASNRRIDEVRDLREKVHIAPTSAKYKVYIIDEVHMLTREAFNALLKTLEEPPQHVIFILATTEVHKLPETIISRTQHYAFKPIDQAAVVSHLRYIADKEKIQIDDAALALVARHGEGSFRDSISLLDQVSSYADRITVKEVQLLLGVAPDETVTSIFDALRSADARRLLTVLHDTRNQGIAPAVLAKQIAESLRTDLLGGTLVLPHEVALRLMERLIEVPASSNPYAALEVSLLNAVFAGQADVRIEPVRPSSKKTSEVKVKPPAPAVKAPVKTEEVEKAVPEQAVTEPAKPATTKGVIDEAAWNEVLTIIKQQYNTMYGVLRMAHASFDGNKLILMFQFPFHQKRVNDPKHKKIIIDAVKEVSGQVIELICEVGKADAAPAAGPKQAKKPGQDQSLGTISNIFGGGELLES